MYRIDTLILKLTAINIIRVYKININHNLTNFLPYVLLYNIYS